MITRWLKSNAPSSPGRSRISKILITIGWWLVCCHSALAQATVNFNNYDPSRGIDAPIYDIDFCGTKLEGTAYYAQLFGGPLGSDAGTLSPMGNPVNFRTGAGAGYVDVGAEAILAIPGVAFGGIAEVQVRAWSANGGATWAAARAAWLSDCFNPVKIGVSNVLILTVPSSQEDPNIPGLVGLRPFGIENPFCLCSTCVVCPEPSTMVLSLFGIAACLLCRPKKRRRDFGPAQAGGQDR